MLLAMAVEQLAAQIDAMVPDQQMLPTRGRGLTIYKHCGPASRTQVVYRPSVCVVARGEKVAHLGAQKIRYDPSRFFFTCVPIPAELEVRAASRQAPLLGLILELELEDVSRICLEIAEVDRSHEADVAEPVTFACPLRPELADALHRLLVCAADEVRHHVLYSGALREVMFALLTGPQGRRLRQVAMQRNSTRAIVESARLIDREFDQPLRVSTLAKKAGMSTSTYHQRFRDVTTLSPLQYQKRIRLHQARALIASGSAVTEAAFKVGYGSASQFSREFRALFGAPPSRS